MHDVSSPSGLKYFITRVIFLSLEKKTVSTCSRLAAHHNTWTINDRHRSIYQTPYLEPIDGIDTQK